MASCQEWMVPWTIFLQPAGMHHFRWSIPVFCWTPWFSCSILQLIHFSLSGFAGMNNRGGAPHDESPSLVDYWLVVWNIFYDLPYGYGSIPINTIFRGMNIHLPAILMITRVQGFDPLPYIGNNDPNWRTPSFFRGVGIPPTRSWWIPQMVSPPYQVAIGSGCLILHVYVGL